MSNVNTRGNWGRWIGIVAILAAVVLLSVVILLTVHHVALWEIYSRYVESAGSLLGLNPFLATGLAVVLFVPFVAAANSVLSLDSARRRNGILGLLAMFALYNLGLYGLTRGQNFGVADGAPLRWYAITPEGVRFFDRDGVDPKYGIELNPVTKGIVEQLMLFEQGGFRPVDPSDSDFFNPLTGAPLLWYYRDSNGGFEFFDKPVFHPRTGKPLLPVTEQIYEEWSKVEREKVERKALEETRAREEEERLRLEAAAAATAVRDQERNEAERARVRSEERRNDEQRRLAAEKAATSHLRSQLESASSRVTSELAFWDDMDSMMEPTGKTFRPEIQMTRRAAQDKLDECASYYERSNSGPLPACIAALERYAGHLHDLR